MKVMRRHFTRPLAEFLAAEAAGGIALVIATVAALVWANGPFGDSYVDFWHTTLTLGTGAWAITEDLQHWVNDGLMVLFFFVVGLEIKRELACGELRDPRAAALPALAALGGIIVPATVYTLIAGGGDAGRGWGIPMATDIAFVVGVLALLGRRVPSGLKLFLLTLAIVDDIAAIGVIAIFYTASIGAGWLAVAGGGLALTVAMGRMRVASPWMYVPVGIIVWFATLQSGVHATIAGVALGLLTPAAPVRDRPVLEELEHALLPWSSYLIVPLFALANAGVVLNAESIGDALTSRVGLAVIVGLVVGKTVGIAGATALGLAFRVGRLPEGVRASQVYAAAALGGIGFTVSLYVAGLAFDDPALLGRAKIGVLTSSVVAGIAGTFALRWLGRRTREASQETAPAQT